MENGTLTPADIHAVMGNGNDSGGWVWMVIVIFIVLFAGNGFGGNGTRTGEVYSTQADIQRAVDLDTLKSGQASISDVVRTTTADVIGAVKDMGYNQLSESKDIESSINLGFANQQSCCCETNRNIDSLRFDLSNYASAIQQNDTANTQKVLDALAQNKIDTLQNQVNQLTLTQAMCGVPKINPYGYNIVPGFPQPLYGGTTIS